MQCREIDNLVMKYLDGNISEIEMEIVKRHNEKCEKCSMEFNILSDAIYTLEELPDIDVPEGFTVKVMNSIRTQKRYILSPQIILLWIMGLAGLATFMINVLAFYVIPAVRSSGILIAAYNMVVYAGSVITNTLKEFLVFTSLALSKLVVFRNIMLTDYLLFLLACIAIFIVINMFIVRTLRLQQKL
ncbi:MAG: anti-sigma factor family protein [Bacillota bacterium]